MKVIKKFTALKLSTEVDLNDSVNVKLCHGERKPYYTGYTSPKEEFDIEEEALEYAYKIDKYATWLIVPIIRFDTFDD